MTQTVSVPSVGDLEFPDGMSQQDMAAAIQKNFPQVHKPSESTVKDIVRQLGLTARYAVEGVTALPNMIGDVLGLNSTKAVSGALTKVGLPEPQNATERVVGDVTRGMAGAALPIGAANIPGIPAKVASVLSAQPGLQVAAGGTGGASSGAARESGAGPIGQTVAGLVGSAVPYGPAMGAALVKGAVRGGEANRVAGAQRIQQFQDAGTTPSAGQAFKTHTAQTTEAFLAMNPGSHGTMRDFATAQAEQMGQKVDDVAGILAGKTSPMVAGRAVEEGITGSGGFLETFKNTSKVLYDKLGTFIPQDTPAKASNTTKTLDTLTKPTQGAEATSKLLVNPKVAQIAEALKSDVGQGDSIPFGALKELRAKVGELLGDSSLTSDIPRTQLKRLYGAITGDMREAVQATGNPQAITAFKRANAYTKAGHQRIDDILQPILDKGAPEKIFTSLLSGSKEGDTMVRGVMQSLPPPSQKALAATVLKKLGRATSANQSAEGDVFSVNTYLTNWDRISPEAKRSLFSRYGQDFVGSLDKIAKTAEDIRTAGRVYANPSGTAPAMTLQHTVGYAAMAPMLGLAAAGPAGFLHGAGVTAAIAGESYLTNQAAKLMTNPGFVKWLAKSSAMPESALPAALNALAQQNKNDLSIQQFVKSLAQ